MLNRKPSAILLVATAIVVAGCGSSKQYANLPRPPLSITLTSAISRGRVTISPSSFGAGPVMLVVANLTPTSQQLSVIRPAPHALDVESGPINPGGTASLQMDLLPGVYAARTQDASIAPQRIVVGAPRPASTNELQLP
jgi:hypothetical protein